MSLLQKLLQLDWKYSKKLKVAEKPGLLRNIARFLAHSGDSWYWLLGLAIVFLSGDNNWKQLAGFMAAGIFITALAVFAIKFSVRRQRPAGEWGAIYRKTDPHSFPSGHAARAAMLAVVALGIGPAWLGWILAAWAPLVILARVMMGVHYLSDVLVGAVLGVATGLLMLKLSYLIWLL
ncbi:MAG: phosphatase PAP2 family protein [Anaerolineales bacterium]|jgi:undecaprenyl-diphosphatase|nr:phosphatase PAP2 family protein [Anaerolineales bacterium]